MVIEKQNKNKNKQQQQKPSPLQNAESSKPRESTSRAAGATVGILGDMFLSQISSPPKAAKSWEGNKVETVVEYKRPQKYLQQCQPFGMPSATQALWEAWEKNWSQQQIPVLTSVAVCDHLLYLLKYRPCVCSAKRCFPYSVLLSQRTSCSLQSLVVWSEETTSVDWNIEAYCHRLTFH